MRTAEIKIYEFKELSQDLQEKAIEDIRSLDYYLDIDFFKCNSKEFLKGFGFGKHGDKLDVYYDLSYCQGADFSIVGQLYFDNFLKSELKFDDSGLSFSEIQENNIKEAYESLKSVFKDFEKELETLGILKEDKDQLKTIFLSTGSVKFVSKPNYGYSRDSMDFNFDSYYSEDKDNQRIGEAFFDVYCDKLENAFKHFKNQVERALLNAGRKELDYQYSDEGVKNFIEANEFEFLENGKRWKEIA